MKSKNTNGFKLSHYFARQKGSIYGFAITAEKEKLQRIASIKNIADMTITKA